MNTCSYQTVKGWMFSVLPLFLALSGFSQAILPTSWSFDTTAPEGWSESLGTGNTRYVNGQEGQACRLDLTGEYVLIEFAEEPGALSYYVKGQNSGGAWLGTFTVQQSTDGNSFTPLRTFSNADMPTASFALYTDQPASTSRFIRFFFTNKVSGHNTALDVVSIASPAPTAEQEIHITRGGDNIPSGLQYSVGNNAASVFTINNQGLANTLTISNSVISGADAAQFSLSGMPSSVSAQSSADFTLNFTPVGQGSRFCTITISSNDASEPSYVIHIYAVAGSLATEPPSQASGLTFPNLSAWNYQVSINAGGAVAERFLVLRRKGQAVSDVPVDGETYVKGDWIGQAQVVHNGPATSFDARSIESSTAYHFAVFAGNGPEGYENYLTSSPLTGSVTTPGPSIGSYYSGVNHQSDAFIDQLHDALNPGNYTQIFYSNYISTMIDQFYVMDTTLDGESANAVACQYSGTHFIYPGAFQWSGGSGPGVLSREHIFPQSWMPTYLDPGFDDYEEVSDLHNLFPVRQNECNSVRSNYPYGDVVDASYVYGPTSRGEDEVGHEVYLPQSSIRGNAARAMMYHATRYFTDQKNFSFPEYISFLIPYGQDEYLVKSWHFGDAPDSFEIARNEYVMSLQKNRNAFVDSVHFPCFIRFSDMTKWEPRFEVEGNELIATDMGLSYQWYLDGEEIDGADSPTLTIETSGDYALEVKQFDQCPSIRSADKEVVLSSVEGLNAEGFVFTAFPNPAEDFLNLRVNSPSHGNATVRLISSTGNEIMRSQHALTPGEQTFTFPLDAAPGVYLLEWKTGEVQFTRLIVVR